MRSLVETLGSEEGITASEFNLWWQIREKEAALDWIDPDPTKSMQFPFANPDQIAAARMRLGEAIEIACDRIGLVRDYPAVEEGGSPSLVPDRREYYGDWYKRVENAVKAHAPNNG